MLAEVGLEVINLHWRLTKCMFIYACLMMEYSMLGHVFAQVNFQKRIETRK